MESEQYFFELMEKAAKNAHVNIDYKIMRKIARARSNLEIPMDRCPCVPNEERGRGCVGRTCMIEMFKGDFTDKEGKRRCHCSCFYLPPVKKD